MKLDRASLACFLDKIAVNYPAGLPLTALVPEKSQPRRECLFVLISADSSLSATHADLLEAICTKGLKFERSVCDIRVVPTWSGVSVDDAAPLTVVLGADKEPGTVEVVAGGKVLYSHPIDLIATQVGLKRDFWGHLQALLRG